MGSKGRLIGMYPKRVETEVLGIDGQPLVKEEARIQEDVPQPVKDWLCKAGVAALTYPPPYIEDKDPPSLVGKEEVEGWEHCWEEVLIVRHGRGIYHQAP